MAVEFRLLGDVAVCVDGRGVDIGHARQRCVLVALLVEANRVVPVDQLVDRVWADRYPQRARNALSGYVSRLRQVLAATGDVWLTRQAGGYLLTVDPMAVDLQRFHHLVTQARLSSDEDETLVLFERALGLWQGVAFATLDTPWLNSVRDALDAERLAVELDRNDLALRLGRQLVLLGELSTCAAAYPLDERVAGQLMLALYRCGRQADALRRYERIRLALTEELGVDPSPPLQELHHRILAADPTLIPPRPPAGAPGQPVPRQLPAPPGSFTGRARELGHLDAIMGAGAETPTVVISAMSGTAGVGKSALVLHWAHRVADRFGDGQLYVNLRGFDPSGLVTSPAEAVRGFLDALDVPPRRIPTSLHAQTAMYRSLLAGRRMLVVLDNARDVEHVRPLLPGTPGCLVLVTSRNQLTSLVTNEGAHPLTLDLLTDTEARDLLARRVGHDRVAAEPDAVAEVITRCARLPLALAIVAARAATHPGFLLETLADELRDSPGGLDALTGTDPLTDLRAVFSWSYRTLSPAAARLFRLLGMHVGPEITAPAAGSLTGLPAARVRLLLTELTHAHLTTEHAPGRYAMHDLLYAYAIELTHNQDTGTERHQATHRMLDHYLHTAHTADRLLQPNRDPISLAPAQAGVTPEALGDRVQAMSWFTAEHSVLLAAVQRAADAGLATHTWQLSWTLTTFFDRRAHWHDWAATQHAAVAAARGLADQHAQAEAHRSLAYAKVELGRYDDAHTHLRRALDLFDALGDHGGRARAHLALSWTFDRQVCPAEALGHGHRALDLYRDTNDRIGQARALNIIGWSYAQLRNHHALTFCQQAIALHQELGDRYGEAASWDSLGYTHHRLGHHEQATTCYHRALDLHRTVGDRYDEAHVLTHIGDTHTATGDLDLARKAWHQALAILTELDHPDTDHIRAALHRLSKYGSAAAHAVDT